MMQTYQGTLCVEVSDSMLDPSHWDWDALINPSGSDEGHTPVVLVGAHLLAEGHA